jgi:hypothetical protein
MLLHHVTVLLLVYSSTAFPAGADKIAIQGDPSLEPLGNPGGPNGHIHTGASRRVGMKTDPKVDHIVEDHGIGVKVNTLNPVFLTQKDVKGFKKGVGLVPRVQRSQWVEVERTKGRSGGV